MNEYWILNTHPSVVGRRDRLRWVGGLGGWVAGCVGGCAIVK